MPVEHLVHVPFMAKRPGFISTFEVSFISDFALHFTQYPITASAIVITLVDMVKAYLIT
ncbi:MAG: hypothetical protein RI911_468 [Candidatus Parcubacteria bacterium]